VLLYFLRKIATDIQSIIFGITKKKRHIINVERP